MAIPISADVKIAQPLNHAVVLNSILVDSFTKLRDASGPEEAQVARRKLRAGLKSVPELLDGLTPAEVDQLSDAELGKLYRQVRQKLVTDRDKMQKLIDALK